ncbi:MAG: zf-HC2 domain-containing protein [Candidatus Omnitrophota bacterium]|jgi:anti-sigma factor RsiW
MKCKRINKLILTDYIDGNLRGDDLKEVELHLGSCPSCRALAQDLRGASKLFKGAAHQEVPSEIWYRIRNELSAAPVRRNFREAVLAHVRYHLSLLKPAVVMACAAALLLFVLAAIQFMPYRDQPGTTIAQDDILAISYTGIADEEDGPEYDFGTSVETFFL